MIKLNSFYGSRLKILITIAIIAGFLLTLIGLSNFSWPWPIPWSNESALFRFIGFLVVATVLVGLFAKRLRNNAILAGALVVALLATAAGAIWPLFVILWFAVSSSLIGYWLASKLKTETNWLNYFLVGAGVYGTGVGLLAHFPANYPGVYGFALVVPVLQGRENLKEWLKELASWIGHEQSSQQGRGNYWLNMAISIVALVYVIVALMPELGHDALAVHLFIPAHLFERHQWGFDPKTYVWAVMPLLGDWIFSFVYMLGGETAARLINVFFIFALSWLIRDLILWVGSTLFGAGWAVLIFLSSPLTFAEGNSLFIESIWASFSIAGALAILRLCSNDRSEKSQLIAAGVLLGLALATKAITLTILPVLLLMLILRYKTWCKLGCYKMLGLGLGLFLLFGCIPYVTAWWITGNPVFPYFNKLFHSPFWPISNFEDARWGKGLTWDFIYRVTFESGRYLESTPGAAGFQWLLVFLPAMAVMIITMCRRGFVLAAFGILTIALCFESMAYLRYIFPAYAVLVAVMGVAIDQCQNISTIHAKLLYYLSAMAVALNLIFFSAGPFVYRDFPIKTIFSETKRQKYLAQRLPIRNAVKLVNALNLSRTPVGVFGLPEASLTSAAGLTSDAVYTMWYNHTFLAAFVATKTTQEVAELLLKSRIDFIIADLPSPEQNLQRALLDKVTSNVAQFGNISVLHFNNEEFLFKQELLTNPDFSSLSGWLLRGEARFDNNAHIVLVTAVSPVIQQIEVSSGQRYKNTVSARCYKDTTQGRVQVNWHDSKGQFIRSDMKLFDCTSDWQEFSMKVTAPTNAAMAHVYATGQTITPLQIKSVSFRQ